MKPRVFIGSSTEGLPVADNLNVHLSKDCETVPWNGGVFRVSETYIESLENALQDVEFAVLVVTPDDLREKRGTQGKIPRDNVVFELGLFMGRLGRKRTYIVSAPDTAVQLPSDLLGISTAKYYSNRSDGDLSNAVQPAATEILNAIRRTPSLVKTRPANMPLRAIADADALYSAIVSWPAQDNQIVIQTSDTSWAWKIVPTLLYWRLNRADVRVVVPPLVPKGANRAEIGRRKLLAELGCTVSETANPSLTGFFLRARYPDESAAIVINDAGSEDLPLATSYQGATDASAIEALLQKLHPVDNPDPSNNFVPVVVTQELPEVLQLLKQGVRQYQPAKVSLAETVLPTHDLLPLSIYARSYKYTQIERLFGVYQTMGREPFTALAVTLQSGAKSILTPPVIEIRNEGAVIMEGTTRAMYCFRNDIPNYHCISVQGVEEELPGTPATMQKLAVSERTLSSHERTEDFRETLFRQIERATHPY